MRVVEAALGQAGLQAADLSAVGIANQRETVVVWDAATGEPVHPAIVWQDTRTEQACARMAAVPGRGDRFRDVTGLPLSSYFSGRRSPGARPRRRRAPTGERGELLAGTVDSWLVWKLTGTRWRAARHRRHQRVADPAHGPALADVEHGAGRSPRGAGRGAAGHHRSSEVYGFGTRTARCRVCRWPPRSATSTRPSSAQGCFEAGSSKSTYGTGGFLLCNTGDEIVRSEHGLLSTVAYQLGDGPPCYALEGSVATAGSLIQWLRDRLELISDVAEVEPLAGSVPDSGGTYVVPAFSGLLAPRWRPDARGIIAGLTAYTSRAHLVRAALEATCFQTREVVEAMRADSGHPIAELTVDGGMVANSLLMQLQADTLQVPLCAPETTESTALGAAFAAGLATGVWESLESVARCCRHGRRWLPDADSALHASGWHDWNRAVDRSLDWASAEPTAKESA